MCLLDARMEVTADDWRLAGMIWSTSCAVWTRLLEFGQQQRQREREVEQRRHAELAATGEAARIEVSERVVAYARKIAAAVAAAEADEPFATLSRSEERKKIKSTLRASWNAGLEYAAARGWVEIVADGTRIAIGDSQPG
jgi:hypothetical protein